MILEKGIGLRNFDVSMIIERGDRTINIDFEINLDTLMVTQQTNL